VFISWERPATIGTQYGGYGYSRDTPLEGYVRDVRIMRIYEGSSEIQRNIIARNVLEQYDE